MSSVEPLVTIRHSADAPGRVDADLLVVPVFQDGDSMEVAGLDDASGGEVRRARESGEFRGKPFELFVGGIAAGDWRPRRFALLGAGKRRDFSMERLRRLATAAGLAARQRRIGRIGFLMGRSAIPLAGAAQAVTEGFVLAEFDSGRYKTEEPEHGILQSVHLVLPDAGESCDAAIARGCILGACSNLARELANEPANHLPPQRLAERALAIHGDSGIQIQVLDEHEIAALGMGLLLGVARGSSEPCRLIHMRYEPPQGRSGPVLGLVGKGVTFDTGGISIKPADGMERMKDDMAGGAAVICAMRAIAALRPPIPVVGVVPATENMPGGRALKPGDVLTSASGKTVEVINTDAEGRLILADALWYARQQGATHLVDIATLTGACVVALGRITSGLFGTPQGWVDVVRDTANRAGDRCWPMPLFEEYAEQLRSEIADMVNVGGRPAGAITAAMFLKTFTGDLPWAHFDVAGTAWTDEAKPFQPKGANGVAVRTLAELAFTSDRWNFPEADTGEV
jgi:leucyl aminopeptidase